MTKYTAADLESFLLIPLKTMVRELTGGIRDLKRAERRGQIGPQGVALPAQGPIDHLPELASLGSAIARKLRDAADGRLEKLERKRLRQAAYRRRRATNQIRG